MSDRRRDSPSLAPGESVGKYEILRAIGAGGMAEVYLARARGIEGFEKVVALKRILPQVATDAEFIDMFLDEARLAATLTHPNVVQVYDIGESEGRYFFTMEYIHGEDLESLVRMAAKQGRGLRLEHALRIVTGAAAGLHYAHDKKGRGGKPLDIVHRDVSPSNILVTFDGTVKVVDFGIAKALARRTKTRSGQIKGKVAYLSPEQCRGETLDRRCDVFALGIILYELTTGKRLFGKLDDIAALHRIANEDVLPPSLRRDGYPEELETIVLRALARDRTKRYGSAQELLVELEDFARERKLSLSAVGLSEFMQEVLGDRTDPTLELSATEQLAPAPAATEAASADPTDDGAAAQRRMASAIYKPEQITDLTSATSPGGGSARRTRLLQLLAAGAVTAGLTALVMSQDWPSASATGGDPGGHGGADTSATPAASDSEEPGDEAAETGSDRAEDPSPAASPPDAGAPDAALPRKATPPPSRPSPALPARPTRPPSPPPTSRPPTLEPDDGLL